MTTSNLVVPLVVWGKEAPTHCIASLLLTPDQSTLITGCNDGHICVWDVGVEWKMTPRNMLFGHTAAVTCLAVGSSRPDKPYIVSSSDNGEMCLWDLSDGRCIEHATHPHMTHTNIQSYQLMHSRDIRLVCNGYYPEIHIIHPWSLEVLFSLSSRIQPDWISACCILRPAKREGDVVVAISNSGTVKVWTLTGNEGKSTQPLYEDEAKQIRCLNAQTLRCCAYNQRTVLIVCSKYWQIYDTNFVEREKPRSDEDGIYDAGDFSLLCSESSRRGERWSGGEFISVDRVVVWSSEGRGYLYKLPTNANPSSEEFRKSSDPSSPRQQGPQAYHVMDMYSEKPLSCCPALTYFLGRRERETKMLLRGDSEGRVVAWAIPDVHDQKMKLVRQESFEKLPVLQPCTRTSLAEYWQVVGPTPEGLIDHLNHLDGKMLEVTATIYIPTQGRLVCGRDDGSIVIVPAVEALTLLLLDSGKAKDTLPRQVLHGHMGRVNCLLYPHNDSTRYDPSHLVSGGVDFTICLWDLSTGNKLHTFCVHGGEVQQLLVPPSTCNPRILPCVASVASDHSLALLSLKERKCIMLAGRQLFPIHTVKWRPLHDFVVLGCTDGAVYVWQMETGHLDRVVHGTAAEDILQACDEKPAVAAAAAADIANPHISLAQALRRRNLATFRNLAQQRIQETRETPRLHAHPAHTHVVHRPQAAPMQLQGLATNSKDPDAHVVFFDTEALIVELLSEEFALLSPSTLEAHGFMPPPTDKDQSNSTDPQRKFAGFIAKVKDKAENVGQRIQAKAESAGFGGAISPLIRRRDGSDEVEKSGARPRNVGVKKSLTMEIAQLFMSCLHAWGQDPDLDKLALSKLGLLHPKLPIAFGLISRGGHMSLLLPGWQKKHLRQSMEVTAPVVTRGHWLISSAVTTQHLLSVISTANTLMSMTNATFSSDRDRMAIRKRLGSHGLVTTGDLSVTDTSTTQPEETEAADGSSLEEQAQTKQGWSLLAALHCVLLPDLIGKESFRSPQLEMLARRWQDRCLESPASVAYKPPSLERLSAFWQASCLEIREAAQALLLAELRRIGPDGRKQVVDDWSPFLPSYVDPALSLLEASSQQAADHDEPEPDDDDDDQILGGEASEHRMSTPFESRRKQAMAIVMMGVLGAEFGQEMEPSRRKLQDDVKKKNVVVDGFGIANYSHARHTSKALTFLLLQPPSPRLPAFTPIRRAAIDLIGRGFTVWEPYLDVSAILLGLLELCVDGDRLVPSMTFGLPLSPPADACRTARHALSLIATARPPAFIITMAKEVARYNALASQNAAQTPHHQLHNNVLVRAKPEILRVLELLVDKIPNEVVDLLVEVMDVTVHCIDSATLKAKGLQEIFPAICRFSMVSYCQSTRRICVGAKNGGVAFYDLKQSKCQVLPAHKGGVTAVAFSPDGKYLASYSHHDHNLHFWQTASSSIFGLGSQQTKCVRTVVTAPIHVPQHTNPLKLVRLIWVDPRTVVLLTVDGSETKFRI